MTKRKSTKRALLLSALSLLMCVSLLIGSTFAWFTDSVTSANNIIKSGNLDVELYYQVEGQTDWTKVTEGTNVFMEDALWEPGHTEVVKLKVVNEGSLALKYQLGVNIAGEVGSVNVYGDKFELSDFIKFGIVDGAQTYNREQAIAAVDATATTLKTAYNSVTTALLVDDPATTDVKENEKIVTMVVYMPTTVDNRANHAKGAAQPTINLGINLFATQYTAEEDSFGPDYDENAHHEKFKVTTANDLQNAVNEAQPGDIIELENDIELSGTIVIPAAPITYARRSAAAPITIDLKGSALTLPEEKKTTTYAIANLGNVILMDSVGGGSVNSRGIYNGYTPDGVTNAGATMTILNGTYNALGTDGGAAVFNYGIAEVKGGTFTSVGGYTLNTRNDSSMTVESGVVANNGIYATGAALTVNGGEISGNRSGCHVVYAWNSGITINGGSFYNNNSGNATIMAAGSTVATVNGGTFGIKDGRIPGNGNTWTSCLLDTSNTAKMTINGGTFNGGFRVQAGSNMVINGGSFNDCYGSNYNINGTVTVCGGAYTDNNAKSFANKYVADGYTVVANNGASNVLKGDVAVGDTAGLQNALTSGEKDIALGAGEFTMPGTSGDVTISGTTDTVINITTPTANNVTLNGVTVVAGSYKGIQHSQAVTFENCVIKGSQFLYADKVVFKNCIVDLTEVADYIWTYSAKNVEFIDCTFNTAGKAILMYNEGPDLVTNVSVKGCTFNATANAGKAAIEIDSHYAANGRYTLVTENNTVDSNFTGEWKIKASATGNTTVNGVTYNYVADGLYKGTDATYYVYNANGLEKMNAMMADKSAGRDAVVNLLADIDFAGKTWKPVDSHADSAFELAELNGNGHTISNLTINGQAMFTRFAGTGDVVIKDLTFDKATVNSNGNINTSILTVQTYQNVLLDNVDVKNSTITGGYKVAPLIATVYNENASSITATLKDCDVENVTVKATSYDFCTAGMVAFVYADDNDKIEFENCTVSNVKLYAPNVYTAHAAVYTTGSNTLFDEVPGVTVTNVTFENI